MEKLMSCDYCNKEVSEVITLGCNHRVCSNCIYLLCLFNNESVIFDLKAEVNLKCMKCNTGELKTNKNFIHQFCSKIINITETVSNKQICQTHYKELNILCKECKAPMCQICFDIHKTVPSLSKHQSSERNEKYKDNVCIKHRHQLLFQCLDCNTLLCEMCTSTDHKDHKVDYIKNFYERREKKLRSKYFILPFSTFEEFDTRLKKEYDLTKEARRKQSVVIGDTIKSIVDSLNRTKKKLLKEMEEELNITYEITKSVYEKFYRELKNVSAEDYITINMLSKLPKVLYFPEMKEHVYEPIINDLKEIKTSIDKLNEEKDFHIIRRNRSLKLDYDNMKTVHTLSSNQSVKCLIELKDGRLVSGSQNREGSFELWEPLKSSNSIENSYSYGSFHNNSVTCLIQLKDGKLLSASSKGEIQIWDVQNDFKCIKTIYAGIVNCLIELEDGKLASASYSTISLYDPAYDYSCFKILTGHSDYVSCLIQLHDGELVSSSNDMSIRVWDNNKEYVMVRILSGHTGPVKCLIQLEDGKLASASMDTTIRIWDLHMNCIRILTGHKNYICALIQLRDGKLASSDGTIRIWDTDNDFKCIKTLDVASSVLFLIQLRNGQLVSGSIDNTINFLY